MIGFKAPGDASPSVGTVASRACCDVCDEDVRSTVTEVLDSRMKLQELEARFYWLPATTPVGLLFLKFVGNCT